MLQNIRLACLYILYHTFCNREKACSEYLKTRDIDVYLPLDDEGNSLFGPYLFIHCNKLSDVNFDILNRARGGRRCIFFGTWLARISDGFVSSLRATEYIARPDYEAGDRVRVVSGSFENFEGPIKQIIKSKKGDRYILLMKVFQREQEIEFSKKQFVAA